MTFHCLKKESKCHLLYLDLSDESHADRAAFFLTLVCKDDYMLNLPTMGSLSWCNSRLDFSTQEMLKHVIFCLLLPDVGWWSVFIKNSRAAFVRDCLVDLQLASRVVRRSLCWSSLGVSTVLSNRSSKAWFCPQTKPMQCAVLACSWTVSVVVDGWPWWFSGESHELWDHLDDQIPISHPFIP